MNWTKIIPAFYLASLSWGWAQSDRLYLVVAAKGPATVINNQQKKQIKLLNALKAGDTLNLAKGSSLTLTNLENGQRYQLNGPLQYSVSNKAVPSGSNVKILVDNHDREGIRVSHAVDMSKYGGFTSRNVQTNDGTKTVHINFENNQPVVLDLHLTTRKPASNGLVFYTPAKGKPVWTQTKAVLTDQKLTLPDFKAQPGTSYYIYIEDGSPDDAQAAFAIASLTSNLTGSLQAQTSKAKDEASQLELYESYRNLRLYWPALKLKEQLKSKNATIAKQLDENFAEIWTHFQD